MGCLDVLSTFVNDRRCRKPYHLTWYKETGQLSLLKPFCPTIALELTLCDTSEKVDMNMVLDSLGTMGVRIGALAYVVAIMLESLLPDDDISTADIYLVKRYNDSTSEIIDEKNPERQALISSCYAEYIDTDKFVYTNFLKPYVEKIMNV